jgi:hypothetical protein
MKLCAEVNSIQFECFIDHLRKTDLHGAIKVIYDIYDYGYSVVDIYDYLFTFIKTTETLSVNEKYLLIPLFCNYITTFYSVHEDSIELALFTNRVYLVLNN